MDDEALREVLGPVRLSKRVVSERVDWRAKAELPMDDDLPEELRKACR